MPAPDDAVSFHSIRPHRGHTYGTLKPPPGRSITGYRPKEDGKPITNGAVAIAYMDAHQPEEDDGGAWEKETEANARRIVAAVNGCEGLSIEALELGIVVELRDALQAASDWIDTQTFVPRTDIQARIRAAIVKAASDRRPA